MKCPECGSVNTKKPSVLEQNYKIGIQRCLDCGHEADWLTFCEDARAQHLAEAFKDRELLGREP